MTDYPSAITVLPDTLKKKRMRLNVTGLKHREIEHLKQNVVILRGDAPRDNAPRFAKPPTWHRQREGAVMGHSPSCPP